MVTNKSSFNEISDYGTLKNCITRQPITSCDFNQINESTDEHC